MPINVGYQIGNAPNFDFTQAQLQQRQLQQQRQQFQQQQMMNAMTTIADAVMKQQQFKQQLELDKNKSLLSAGLMPTTERYTPGELRNLPLEQFNQMVAPGGSFTQGQGLPQRPDTYNIPGFGFAKKSPTSLMNNVTISPEGELAYKIGDAFVPIKSVSKTGISVKGETKPEVTKTTAISILSDPVKSEQLKMTYPEVYSLIEGIATSEETKPKLPTVKPVQEEGRVNVVSPQGKRGTIPKSQLPEALKSGYKKVP